MAAGLVFAVHPVHVESVAWVQGRVDLLSSAGVLLAVILAVAGSEAPGRRRRLYWAASALAYLLGMLSKEVAIVAPLLTAVVLAARADPPGYRSLWHSRSLLVLHGLALLLYLGLRAAALGSPAPGLLGGPPIGGRLLLALHVIPVYLRLLVLPVGLNPKHPVPVVSGFLDGEVLLGAGLLLCLAAVGCLWARRPPGLAPGLVWTAIAWLPASNLVPIAGFVVAERYLYLPSVGFSLVVAGAATSGIVPGGRRRGAVAVAAVALMALAGLAASQARIWENMRTFYEALAQRNPDSVLARNNLGSVYLGLGEDDRAEGAFREALRLQPGHPGALNNLGILAQRRGELVEARRLYWEALRARPTQPDTWNNLGSAYEAEGDLARAAGAYRQAVRLDRTRPQSLADLARVLAAQGERAQAVTLLQEAVALDPATPRWRSALAALRDAEQRSPR
jgi:Flp pilus assembly protein TadD